MARPGRGKRTRSDGATLKAVADPLEVLAAALRAREAAETSELDAVRAARDAGASWTDIGDVYGLTKQGAQQRFKPLLDIGRQPVDDAGRPGADGAGSRPAGEVSA